MSLISKTWAHLVVAILKIIGLTMGNLSGPAPYDWVLPLAHDSRRIVSEGHFNTLFTPCLSALARS